MKLYASQRPTTYNSQNSTVVAGNSRATPHAYSGPRGAAPAWPQPVGTPTLATPTPNTEAPAVSSSPRKPPTKAPQVAPPVTTAVTVTPTTPPQPSTVETVTPQDTLAPTVTFTAVPAASSTSRAARFEFTASEPSATFECSYDATPFAQCASPHTVEDVGVDDHSLAVRATDAAGNVGAPAVARWTVVPSLPDLVAVLANGSVTVTNRGEGAAGSSIVLVQGVGSFTVPALAPGQSATRTYTCKSGTITAIADETQLVAEADEGNNTATRVVTCLGLT